MNAKTDSPQPKRAAELRHRKQTFWQVYFPLLVVGLLFLTLAVLIISGASSAPQTNQKLANIATMYLFIPLLIFSLPILALLIGLNYLVSKAFPYLPRYGSLITEKLEIVRTWIATWTDKASRPFIMLPSAFSGVQYLQKEIVKMLRSMVYHE